MLRIGHAVTPSVVLASWSPLSFWSCLSARLCTTCSSPIVITPKRVNNRLYFRTVSAEAHIKMVIHGCRMIYGS
ncbi:hypothetical protein HDV62DRAFT_349545 [Trichoderma sp. SZMC 28011]